MSVKRISDLEIKEILEDLKLYNPEMSISDMRFKYYTLKYKQALEAAGLYEEGMTDNNIMTAYISMMDEQENAGNDNENSEILNRIEPYIDEQEESIKMLRKTADVTKQEVNPKPQELDTPEDKSEIKSLQSGGETENLVENDSIRSQLILKRKNNANLFTYDEGKRAKISDDLNSINEIPVNAPSPKWIKRVTWKLNPKSKRKQNDSDNIKSEENPNPSKETISQVQNMQEITPVNELVTTVNVPEEEQASVSKYSKIDEARTTSPRNRPLLHQLALQKIVAMEESQMSPIETNNCFICSRTFPLSKTNGNKTDICDICNEYVCD